MKQPLPSHLPKQLRRREPQTAGETVFTTVKSPPSTVRESESADYGLDYLEAGYLVLLAAFLVTSWVGFTLAEFGLDHPLPILLLGAVGLIVGTITVLRRPWRRVGWRAALGLCPSLIVGALLYFPPDEWILGALDPGVYVNTGVTIARTGGIVLKSALFGALAESVRQPLFFLGSDRLPGFHMVYPRFSGLTLDGYATFADRVVPHGFHFYPSVLAFGYAVGGIRAELLVTPMLALAGIAGFYLLVRRLFGAAVAALATLFVSIGPAEVWFARYPAAEILAQVLLFGGFLAFVAMLDTGSRWLAILSGLALGAIHLEKIEMLPLPFLIAAFFGYQAVLRQFDRQWLWFLGTYGLIVVQAILHALLISSFYTVAVLSQTISARLLVALLVACLAALLLAASAIAFRGLRDSLRALLTNRVSETLLSLGLPLLVGLLAMYAYYIRPLHSAPVPLDQMSLAQIYAMNNLQSFVRLGWYVSPIGLLLGTIGWMMIFHQRRDRRSALLFLAIAAETLIFLGNSSIAPGHFWAARRWVPLVIPGFCLAAAYLVVHSVPRQPKRWIEAALPLGCAVVMMLGLLGGIRPLLGYVEYRGALQQVGTLASTVPPNAIVLFTDGDLGQRLSTPMEYLFQRTSLIVPSDRPGKEATAAAVRDWLAEGRPVYWVTTPGLPDPTDVGLPGTIVARETIALPEKLATYDRRPGFVDGVFLQGYEVWKLGAQ